MPPEGLPTVGRQAAKKSKQIEPLRLCACLPQVGLCETIFLFLQRREAYPPRRIGRPAVGSRKEKRVGPNLKCHLLKEKTPVKVPLQLRLQLYF
jgi:hypothetical protein